MQIKKSLAVLLSLQTAALMANGMVFSASAAESEVSEVTIYEPPKERAANICGITTGTDEVSEEYAEDELPASYDLRKAGLVSSVKNQYNLGTCWAHAALSCVETSLIADYPQIDLSEMHLAYYENSYDFGDGSFDYNEGSNLGPIVSLLTNWIGPVYEWAAPYMSDYYSELSREEVKKEAAFHVNNVKLYSYDYDSNEAENQRRALKNEIYSGNSIYFSLPFDSGRYYSYECNSYYGDPDVISLDPEGHAMTIVGWDDSFSRRNFNTVAPIDGAWLVKNSWGEDFGEYGYFWISFAEPDLKELASFRAEDAANHDDLYSHDDYGTATALSASKYGDETVSYSNVYTAENNCWLTDVMTCCMVPDDTFEITVYTDLQIESDPTSGTPVSGAVITNSDYGYATVKLDKPVYVETGEKFSVVADVSGRNGWHIPCEAAFDPDYIYDSDDSKIVKESNEFLEIGATEFMTADKILRTFSRGQSFFSRDGKEWTDIADTKSTNGLERIYGNISLRVLTQDVGKVLFSEKESYPEGAELELTANEDADIMYSVNGGEYVKYNEPIKLEGEMSISAYTQCDGGKNYSRNFEPKKAVLSSLFTDSVFSPYVPVEYSTDLYIMMGLVNDEITLYPTTTGKVIYEGKTYDSYSPITISMPQNVLEKDVSMTVEQDGIAPTEYNITIEKRMGAMPMTGWYVDNQFRKFIYFDADLNEGYYTERSDGIKRPFTAEIGYDNVSVNWIDSGETDEYGFANSGYSALIIDGENSGFYQYCGEEEFAYYISADLAAMAEEYYTAVTGEVPADCTYEYCDSSFGRDVLITITADDGTITTYTINYSDATGIDSNGRVVDLNDIPEADTDVELRSGVWKSMYDYYLIDTEENYIEINARPYASYDGIKKGRYSIDGNQLTCRWGDGTNETYAVSVSGDEMLLVSKSGEKIGMQYICDEEPDAFMYFNGDYIRMYIMNYFRNVMHYEVEEEDIALSYYDDLSVKAYVLDYLLTIDDVTLEAYDEEGNYYDLSNCTPRNDKSLPSGIWKSGYNYYSFSEDGESYIAVIATGNCTTRYSGYLSTYRNRGVMNIQANDVFFDFEVSEDRQHITLFYDDGKKEELTYVQEGSLASYRLYAPSDIREMIRTDAIQRTGRTDIMVSEIWDENGVVTGYDAGYFENYDYVKAETYTDPDPHTGECVTEDGETVSLPQTGNNSPVMVCTAAGAAILTLTGIFGMAYTGSKKRKHE